MSSPYPVLDNKPIDQWKVTELKEELKRRKLATKGLKDDLIRRLDDALRAEMDSSKKDSSDDNDNNVDEEEDATLDEQVDNDEMETEVGNGFDSEAKPPVGNEGVGSNAVEAPVVLDTKIDEDSVLGKLDKDVSDDDSVLGKLDKDISVVDSSLGGGESREEESVVTIDTVQVVSHTATVSGSVETNVTETRTSVTLASSVQEPQDNGIKVEKEASHEVAVLNNPSQNNQN